MRFYNYCNYFNKIIAIFATDNVFTFFYNIFLLVYDTGGGPQDK